MGARRGHPVLLRLLVSPTSRKPTPPGVPEARAVRPLPVPERCAIRLSTGVMRLVKGLEPRLGYVGVDLGRGKVGVAKHHLHRP